MFDENIGFLQKEWGKILHDLNDRNKVLKRAKKNCKNLSVIENDMEIAAVDVFVEKAQQKLTIRAKRLIYFGLFSIFMVIFFASMTFYYIDSHDISKFMKSIKESGVGIQEVNSNLSIDGYVLTMWIARSATLSALGFVGIFTFLWLSRALLHEAFLLYHRRHCLRFGRLYMYVKYSRSSEIKNLTIDEMEQAFFWHHDVQTAIKDIDVNQLPKGGLPVDQIPKIIEAAASSIRGK